MVNRVMVNDLSGKKRVSGRPRSDSISSKWITYPGKDGRGVKANSYTDRDSYGMTTPIPHRTYKNRETRRYR